MAIAGESSGNNHPENDSKVSRKRKRKPKVGLAYDERMCKHDTPDREDHPECPNRIRVIWEKLQLAGVDKRCVVLGGNKAEDKDLRLVHTKEHVNFVKSLSTKPKDSRRNKIASKLNSIYLNGGSSEAAYLAAGCVVEVAEKVAQGELDCGFAIVRPPGHHAEPNEAMGFCLFNNVAVAASYLLNQRADLGIKKILIVDWDVHHGNGTQKMYWKDPRVLVFSVHRHDGGRFYPEGDDGYYNMVGEGPGEGFNINVPWEQGKCGDADYLAAWDNILIPVAKEFNPDIVLLSAGFDAAIGDPLGGCCVTPYGYSVMLKELMEFAQGKIVMALEGGYNLDSIAKSSLACVQVLLEDKPVPVQGSSETSPLESTWRVIRAVRKRLCAYWPSLVDQKTPPPSRLRVLQNIAEDIARAPGFNFNSMKELDEHVAEKLSFVPGKVTNVDMEEIITFTKNAAFLMLTSVNSFSRENGELRDKLMTATENLKTVVAEKNQEIENLKSSLTAREGELEAQKKESEALWLLVKAKEERLSVLRVRVEDLERGRR